MAFIVNDCSLHGQFDSPSAFHRALSVIMRIREQLRSQGAPLYCHRELLTTQVGPSLNLQQGVAALPKNEQRAVMVWLNRQGPFWADERTHGRNEYLTCHDDIVTDTALGEAAWRALAGVGRWDVVSFAPSDFEYSPVVVEHTRDDGTSIPTEVTNHWHPGTIDAALEGQAPPIDSWAGLEATARGRLTRLTITDDAFAPLRGCPFSPNVASRFHFLLIQLDRLRACVDENGERTEEGHEIYLNFFTGEKARFSDSSDTEKAQFRSQLTFQHPENESEELFCPWHGKMNPPFRLHFTYPVSAEQPLYVVYLGPKLTKR